MLEPAQILRIISEVFLPSVGRLEAVLGRSLGEYVRKALGWTVIAAVVLWVAAFFVLKASHDQTTDSMVAAANQLAVPDSWTLVSEVVESEKLICLNANPCPSLHRRWQADNELTFEDFRRLGASADWDLNIEDDCTRRPGDTGKDTVCSGVVIDSGYRIELRVLSTEPGAASELVMSMKPSGG